jgi:hypothetical protein
MKMVHNGIEYRLMASYAGATSGAGLVLPAAGRDVSGGACGLAE